MSIKARFARRWNQKGSKTLPKSLHKAAITPKIGFPPLLYGYASEFRTRNYLAGIIPCKRRLKERSNYAFWPRSVGRVGRDNRWPVVGTVPVGNRPRRFERYAARIVEPSSRRWRLLAYGRSPTAVVARRLGGATCPSQRSLRTVSERGLPRVLPRTSTHVHRQRCGNCFPHVPRYGEQRWPHHVPGRVLGLVGGFGASGHSHHKDTAHPFLAYRRAAARWRLAARYPARHRARSHCPQDGPRLLGSDNRTVWGRLDLVGVCTLVGKR